MAGEKVPEIVKKFQFSDDQPSPPCPLEHGFLEIARRERFSAPTPTSGGQAEG